MSFRELVAYLVDQAGWIPNWLVATVLLATAAGLALLAHRTALRLVRRLIPPGHDFLQSLTSATRGIFRVGLVVLAIALGLPAAPLARGGRLALGHALVGAFV